MEQHEARLFDLLESKDFSELTPDEAAYVGEYLTEDEYRLQQRLIWAAQNWAPDPKESDVVPLPLLLPESVSPLKRTIPLYQALLAIAAVIVFFLLLPAFGREVNESAENPVAVKKEVVHDTVVEYITHVDTVVLREQRPKVITTVAPLTAVEVHVPEGELVLPEINEADLRTQGHSMREDNTYQLIPAGRGW